MKHTSSATRVGNDLTQGPVARTLLTFAAPIVLANIVQQMYSLADVIIIGHFVGNIGTVGVNTGGELADMAMPVAMGFSSAGQIYIAQLYGSKKFDKLRCAISTLLGFMLMLSVIIAITAVFFADDILVLLNCPPEAMGQATAYMTITALGLPFVYGYNAVTGILRSMGEGRRPLYFVSIAATVNIFLNLLLVIVFQLEAAGTAIATVFSQFASFLAAFLYLRKHKDKFGLSFSLKTFRLDPAVLFILIKLGIPQVVRSLLVRFSMVWVNATANSFGLVVSATNSIGNKLQKFLEVFIMGVDTGASSMIGQNLGAHNYDRARKTTNAALISTLICATGAAVICILIPEWIFGLFTQDTEVIALGSVFLRIFIIHFYTSAITGSYQAMVTGSGFVTLGFAIGILDGVICKLGLSLLFLHVFQLGYTGLFWGVSCSRILPAFLCAAYFYSGKWRTRKLLSET